MWSPGLAGWRLFLWPSAPLCIVLHCKPHCATSAWPILTQTALHCRSAGGDLEHSNEIQRTVTNHQYLMSWGWTKEFYVEVNFARRIGSQLVWLVTNKQTNKQKSLLFWKCPGHLLPLVVYWHRVRSVWLWWQEEKKRRFTCISVTALLACLANKERHQRAEHAQRVCDVTFNSRAQSTANSPAGKKLFVQKYIVLIELIASYISKDRMQQFIH